MTLPKTTRPATAETANGPRKKSDQLGSEISPTNTPKPARPQAPPDDRGESDFAYFSARPGISSRKRLAFDFEPLPGLLESDDSVAFVSVRVQRDGAGLPQTIFRVAICGEWGHA
jgi:hypothetical protein